MSAFTSAPAGDSRRHRWWLCALAALVPAAVVLVLIAARYDAGPRDFLPVWNDEVIYWNEIAVFAEAGFNGGYVTLHEVPAPAAFSRFGPHGPLFAIFHGTIARATGLQPYTGFILNLIVVSLAAFVWLRYGAAGVSPAALLLVAAFWPLLLYLPTHMQEPTHFAFAFLFALAIERHVARAGVATTMWTALLLGIAALMRPSWALLILPLGWRRARRAGARGIVPLVALTIVAGAAASKAFDALASPSPIAVHVLTRTLADDPLRVPALVAGEVARNLGNWFSLADARPPEAALRYFIALLLAVLVAGAIRARREDTTRAALREAALLAVAPAVAAIVGFGDVESWRDFRVLAPHVLIALLLMASAMQWERWLWAATLVLLPLYYDEFGRFHEHRFTTNERPAIAALRDAVAPVMTFTPGASPWANSVAVPAELLQFPLLGLPRGLGISYVTDWQDMARDIRSGYLLLRPADEDELKGRVMLTPLADTPLGRLYRNADR